MNKKSFIIAIIVVASLAIGTAAFILWPRSTVDTKGSGAPYELSSEDKTNVESITRDFVNRTSNFGLVLDSNASSSDKAHTVYDFSLAIAYEDYSKLFETRYASVRKAADLIAPEASFYPSSSSEYDFRMDEDVFGYRSYSSQVKNVSVPSQGNHQLMSRGEELPSVTLQLEINSSVQDRSPKTMESKEDLGISAKGLAISERSQMIDQSFAVQLVKTKAGWKIYSVTGGASPEVLSIFTPSAKDHESLMQNSSTTSYNYEFTAEDGKHEH